jgi:hypothetical protein
VNSFSCIIIIRVCGTSKVKSTLIIKNVAYGQLRVKLSEIDPEATKEAVLKNSLRSCFRKELKKVKDSQKSGNETDDNYTPSLRYYVVLLFLTDQELPTQSVSSLDSPEEVSIIN